MKKIALLLSTIFCQVSVWSNPLVFATPLDSEQTQQLRTSPFFNTDEEAQFFQDIGISNCRRWIQKLQGREFLIQLVKGEDLNKSLEMLNNAIEQKNPAAIQANIELPVNLKELTPMLEVNMDQEGSLTKEYCFIYSILPSKIDKLYEMFQDKEEYFSEQVRELYRHRGISKMQLWIQEEEDASYLVAYQEVTGPVKEGRKKYLDGKDEEYSKNRGAKFSEVTGLSYEELLPKLESLFDGEILN